MLRISDDERRNRLQVRHRLSNAHPASTPDDATASVVALHASDPASVYLSVLARAPEATLDDVSAALYDRRSLVRLMGMRRTLFVVPEDTVACVHHSSAVPVADRLRRRLVKELETLPLDPPIDRDVDTWLAEVEGATVELLRTRDFATAQQLSAAEPRLRTATLPVTDKKYDIRRTINSRVLTILGAYGRIVRGAPRGDWTSRAHTWEPAARWWPEGIPELTRAEACSQLVERWLRVFGPATVDDLAWWTGWSLTDTRDALSRLDTTDVALGEADGIVLTDDTAPTPDVAPSATLLPGLDPTPMGWKHREWYLGAHAPALFDRNGNIGPTVWWDGRVVGGWGVAKDASVAWRLLEDIGTEASAAVEAAAENLQKRLDGTIVVPSFRTPLERELSG